jgi:hypothetical protein
MHVSNIPPGAERENRLRGLGAGLFLEPYPFNDLHLVLPLQPRHLYVGPDESLEVRVGFLRVVHGREKQGLGIIRYGGFGRIHGLPGEKEAIAPLFDVDQGIALRFIPVARDM